MKRLLLPALVGTLALLAAAPATAQRRAAPPPAPAPLTALADQVSEAELRRIIDKLVSFGTRHTLSEQNHPTRGIGASLRWSADEFRRISRACNNCLTIAEPSEIVTGRRIPQPTKVWNVLGIQRGTTEPNRVIIISGHIDSRVTDVMDATSPAPGANDDGSGTAAVLEAARVLSKHRFPATIVYAVLSGEEQGLYGGKILADYAKAQGWQVGANLNNDIIGNSCGSDGVCDPSNVRVFSEGPRWQGREDLAARQRSLGGENDSPSRNLSRFLAELAPRVGLGLDVRQIWRNDRFGRGGDHTELLNAGYPAIRFSVAVENYNHQHQDLRVENGVEYGDTVDKMDFPYLRNVTALNVAALAALARAPMPPEPTVEGAVSTSTKITWSLVPGGDGYVIRWRRTDANQWEHSLRVWPGWKLDGGGNVLQCGQNQIKPGVICSAALSRIRVDDWIFGVSSVAADGSESPVAAAVPGGAFKPYTPPPPATQ
jgi:hypothetical protein